MHELIHSFYEVLRQFSETATVLIFYKIFWILITSFFYWHDYNCNAWCAFYLNEQNILTANQKKFKQHKSGKYSETPRKATRKPLDTWPIQNYIYISLRSSRCTTFRLPFTSNIPRKNFPSEFIASNFNNFLANVR